MSEKRIFHSFGIHNEGAGPACINGQTCVSTKTHMSELLIVLIDGCFLSLLNYIVFLKTISRQQNADHISD